MVKRLLGEAESRLPEGIATALGNGCKSDALGRRLAMTAWGAGVLLIAASSASAQAPIAPAAGYRPANLLEAVISTVVFSLIGIILAIVGFKLFDAVIPFSLEREICEKSNIAVALLASAMVLGICIIVAFVVLS